jgi:hypothetical protein
MHQLCSNKQPYTNVADGLNFWFLPVAYDASLRHPPVQPHRVAAANPSPKDL